MVYKVQVKDPWISQITAITRRASMEAQGSFRAGKYIINGIPIFVQEGTSFRLNFSLPIDNPNYINTANVTGELWTSEPLHLHGVSLPKSILIENGKVTGQVDFVRLLASFLFNLLQEQSPASPGNDMRAMISSLHLKTAKLDLRDGSVFSKNDKTFHIGRDSQITLENATVDKDLNYVGTCHIDLNFLPDNKWVGKKVNCDFDGGNAHLILNIVRSNDLLTFFIEEKQKQEILLEKALFKFGKNKQSEALCQRCAINLVESVWKKSLAEQNADLHILANMKLNKTNLCVKTEKHKTTAYFPDIVPAKMQIDINQTGRETQFQTVTAALAQKAVIEIFKPSSKVSLSIERAKIGPICFDKSGNLNLSFAAGSANLKELRWGNDKKYLILKSAGLSQLSLPQGMYMLLDKDTRVKMSLPLNIKMGAATIESTSGKLGFSSIDGKVLIKVDKEIVLQGDIAFVLEESSFLGEHKVAVDVHGFTLAPKKAIAIAHLQKCVLLITNEELLKVIQNQFPKEKCLNMDKTIFEKRHWRYRNAEIRTVKLCDLKLEKLKATGVNSAKLTVSAEVTVEGTIEKNSVLSIIKEYKSYKSKAWQIKAWQIKADCTGFGDVQFKFISNGTLSKSELPYSLKVDLPIPDDVKLDWSKVENGIYKGLEHGIILSILKNMRAIPLSYQGVQPLFNRSHTELNSIKLSNMSTKGTLKGVQIDFAADASF